MKKYLTIEDLLVFCKQANMNTFSAKDAGGPIIIQSFGEISTSDTTTMGLTPCTLQACHTELNKNHSFIEDNVMNNALASFANRPILGYIHQLEDGSWNFWDHRIDIEEDGDETRVSYLESPIGVIPESCNAHLEYDKKHDKNYVVVNGYIYDDYGNRALDIIKENNGKVTVSVELAINSMSYNAKENYLNIEDFTFMGVTCLGKTPDGSVVQPGMEGSNLKLDNFSVKQNSMFANNFQDRMIEILDKLNTILSNFNNNSEEKGCDKMDNFENTAVDEIKEENTETTEEVVEEVMDEETSTSENGDEVVENEACGGKKKKKCEEEGSEEEPVSTEQEACGGKKKKKCSIDENGDATISFEISHEDIRGALYNLLGEYEANDNEWYFVTNVYDNYFLYENWEGSKCYKQCYALDGDNVSFDGDRQEMFKMILTESEKLAIDKLRGDYAELETKYNELKTFKDNYDAAEMQAKKDEVFAKKSYEKLAGNEAFEDLKKNAANFSFDEIVNKAKIIYADFMENIEVVEEEPKKVSNVISVSFAKDTDVKDPYGGLWTDYKKKNKK